jgi:hypothetical protein
MLEKKKNISNRKNRKKEGKREKNRFKNLLLIFQI